MHVIIIAEFVVEFSHLFIKLLSSFRGCAPMMCCRENIIFCYCLCYFAAAAAACTTHSFFIFKNSITNYFDLHF